MDFCIVSLNFPVRKLEKGDLVVCMSLIKQWIFSLKKIRCSLITHYTCRSLGSAGYQVLKNVFTIDRCILITGRNWNIWYRLGWTSLIWPCWSFCCYSSRHTRSPGTTYLPGNVWTNRSPAWKFKLWYWHFYSSHIISWNKRVYMFLTIMPTFRQICLHLIHRVVWMSIVGSLLLDKYIIRIV